VSLHSPNQSTCPLAPKQHKGNRSTFLLDIKYLNVYGSVADPDPGPGAFLNLGSKIRDG
jgi:hypothetical protein